MSTYTQKLIHKIATSVASDLTDTEIAQVGTFTTGPDTLIKLRTLCDDLKTDIAALTGSNTYIARTAAINTVLEVCQLTLNERVTGTATFFHDDNDHSHVFYTCDGPNATPTLLYTATNDLSSISVARAACDNWSAGISDLYGSYTNSCADVLPLGDLASSYCNAGIDYLVR